MSCPPAAKLPCARGLHVRPLVVQSRQMTSSGPSPSATAALHSNLGHHALHSTGRERLGKSWQDDPDKPVFHLMPEQGWLNDPNGLIWHKGRYHLFFQHIPDSSDWAWRMCWGHLSSKDLVHWEREPLALEPTLGGPDESGCWSGNCVVDNNGVPTILYTGVRMGQGPYPRTPDEIAVGQPVVETQCAATAEPGDERLRSWTKADNPVIAAPPPGLQVMGFRDPYVLERGIGGSKWKILIGSGIYEQGGTLLVYSSDSLFSGWTYEGPLCAGRQSPTDEYDTGAMWECPFLIRLPHSSSGTSDEAQASTSETPDDDHTHMLCISPYPHLTTHRPTNHCLYWLGKYVDGRFLLEEANGPHPLDLGDAVYAPNSFSDGAGRALMFGWMQELSRAGSFDYKGCMTLPRVLSLRGGRLHQEPAPELRQLRTGASWQQHRVEVSPQAAAPIPHISGGALNIEVTLERGSAATTVSGLLFHSHQGGRVLDGSEGQHGAAVLLDWRRSELQVVFPHHLDQATMVFDADGPGRRLCGPIRLGPAQESVRLQVFLDHSALEVFASTGEALATRVYGRQAPAAAENGLSGGVWLVSQGGPGTMREVEAYTMASIWEPPPAKPQC